MVLEAEDIFLGKARFKDWEAMYRNVWSRPETARFMMWEVTATWEEAKDRIKRTILFQETHDTYLIYEKKHGQAIGFAGVGLIGPGIYEEMGIALGPEYVGRGYGKQVLCLLLKYCTDVLKGKEFYYYTRAENKASKALALSCGFVYQYSEKKEQGTGKEYMMEVYCKKLCS
ncbi:MAG: GNAT family N-acetyltransferase [Dorea sp.]|nr:GNAT family N-acetyltransferase [Dorea sp.]